MAVFNREDGKLAMGSKTPVSILQELLHKKGMTPHYELIYNGTGTKDPLYKFKVSAMNMIAIGDGKTKKEAKHDAAATLLNRLLGNREFEMNGMDFVEGNHKEGVDIASPYTGSIKMNFVGKLDEICVLNKIPIANYTLASEEGPPHARIFAMKCTLGKFSEVAVARTKKQAKHLVAQKMIDKMEKLLKERFIPAQENEEPAEEIVRDQEKIKNGNFIHDWSYEVKQLHNIFHVRKDEVQLPSIFVSLPEKPEEFYKLMEDPMTFLEEVVDALEGVVTRTSISPDKIGSALEELSELLFEDDFPDSYKELKEIEAKEQGSESDSIINVLPEFLSSDPKEDEKPTNSSFVGSKIDECVDQFENIEIVEDYTLVFCNVKVEIPLGLWNFIGRGRNEEEASVNAARQALQFLRTMAIPPPGEFS
ncbi:uncharacterized protein LOC128999664 isoform X1 [Macrosteles quadrilineatus]|uniref:uncharacterized protein LOC128999664 isoform X1 n=1 Tax=Macrosteles quadrilineatus TaxID=74068 RepID=UPI0023E1EA6F|nr:uncharacterized protein LOC128999664 isoform X1 [Macrosteles quadrilineatus]